MAEFAPQTPENRLDFECFKKLGLIWPPRKSPGLLRGRGFVGSSGGLLGGALSSELVRGVLDDFLRDVARAWGVVAELHGELATA